MPMPRVAAGIQSDVLTWGKTVTQHLPEPDTEAYEEMIYFDLEAIRNAGLATYQFLPEMAWDLRPAVETVTDLLTSLRYGNVPGQPLQYVRTAYVPGLPMDALGYPQYVVDDCLGGLEKLIKHKEIFEKDANPACLRKFRDFQRAVEIMVGEVRMSPSFEASDVTEN